METEKSGLPFELRQEVPVEWSDLPADLVTTISKKLHDPFDFVYFRAVCKKWRTATSISDLPPQFPWILEWHNKGHLCIYSLISGKNRTIHCPNSRGMCLDGPSHGYLHRDMNNPKSCLLNPLTNDEVSIEIDEEYIGFMLCMSPNLMGSHGYIAFDDEFNTGKVWFYQPLIREWCYVQSPLLNLYSCNSQACFRGYYLADTGTNNTVVIEIASCSTFLVPFPDIVNPLDHVYFVESAGKILRIVRRLDRNSVSSSFSFDIYQLDVIEKNCEYKWLRISSIGNQVFFLDRGSGISIAACETARLRKNCIYWLQCCHDRILYSEVEVHR